MMAYAYVFWQIYVKDNLCVFALIWTRWLPEVSSSCAALVMPFVLKHESEYKFAFLK